MAQIFKFSFDNESIQSSVLAFLSPFRFWKGICKVASWIGLEILVPNHPWKSKIGPLQPILAAKCYVSFFWVTLYQYHIKITFWPFSLQEGKKWSALADSRIFVNLNQLNGHFLVLTFATIAILLNTLVSTFGGVPLSLIGYLHLWFLGSRTMKIKVICTVTALQNLDFPTRPKLAFEWISRFF